MHKILIGMSDTGGGHRSAAESLATVIERQRGGEVEVIIADLLSDHTFWPLNQIRHAYAPVVNKAEPLWKFIWWLPEAPWRWELLQKTFHPALRGPMGGYLQAQAPDLYVSVHPLLNHIPLQLLRAAGNRCPVATVVTDLAGGHPTWFCPAVDLCSVGSQALYDVAIERRLPADRVKLLGLPVNPRFSVPASDQATLRRSLGLAADRPTALLIGGGEGMGPLARVAAGVAAGLAPLNGQMAVICGRNEKLRAELAAAAWPVPVSVQGFVRNMSEWMAASDCIVTKAGPGTIIEGCIIGRPILISDFIQGQETGNVAYVVDHGIGAYAADPVEIGRIVADWLRPGNPALAAMSARARSLARPEATEAIVDALLALLPNGQH